MSNSFDTIDVSRRSVLRKSAVASGLTLTVGTALAETTAGSPNSNFGYVKEGTSPGIPSGPFTLPEPSRREKAPCNAGASGSDSQVKTEVFVLDRDDDDPTEELYLLPSGYDAGDRVKITGSILTCTRSEFIAEVTVERV